MGSLNRYPLIIFITLLFCSITLIPFISKDEGQTNPISKLTMSVNYYLYAVVHNLKLSATNLWAGYLNHQEREQEFKALMDENVKLRSQLLDMQEIKIQNERLEKLLDFASKSKYEVVPANVIGGGTLARSELLLIDRGESYGIKTGMVVATPKGIVGKVFRVGGRSSYIMLITDPISVVDAVVQRTRARGIVKGNTNGCVMEYLENRLSAKEGDLVITSGKDGLPKGILIGQVKGLEKQGGVFKADLLPEVSVGSIEEVIVIKNGI